MGEHQLSPRFFTRFEQIEGCWLWTGRLDRGGYGRFNSSLAHRLSYEHFVGPIPKGFTLDHLCRTHACVNPAHLEPATIKVNTLRGVSFAAVNAKKTHCPKGHAYDEENTYVNEKGNRDCRACKRAWARRNRRRKAASRTDEHRLAASRAMELSAAARTCPSCHRLGALTAGESCYYCGWDRETALLGDALLEGGER